MPKIRTLPIRLAPTEGEALDSWLEALAHRCDVRWRDILTAVGLPAGRFGVFAPIVALDPSHAATAAAATGVSAATLVTMTLSRYEHVWLRTAAAPGTVSRGLPWGRLHGSRYCPTCLAESRGRWQLAWRLGWSFACTKHHRLLADICPTCAGAQRVRSFPANYAPTPGSCAAVTIDADKGWLIRCGTDLTTTTTPRLGRTHPIIKAQRIVYEIIDSGTATFRAYRDHAQPTMYALADVRQRAAHLLATATRADLASAAGLTQLGVTYDARRARVTALPGNAGATESWSAAPHAAIAAIAISAAVKALQKRPINPATQLPSRRRTAPPAAEMAALGPVVNPSDELRHRTEPSASACGATESNRINHLPRAIPTMLWPAWSLRFALPHLAQRQLRPALSVLLLLVDTRLRLAEATELLSSPIDKRAASRILQLLSNRTDWPDIRTALGRLADYLLECETPIDYQRRRQLDYQTLLPDSVWAAICRNTGTPAPGPTRARLVRCYLYEQLSGRPADAVESWHVTSELRTKIADYPLEIDTDLAGQIEDHCRDFLASNGIDDEPPCWSPPTCLFDDLQMPAPSPERVDIPRMRHLLATSDRPLGHTARQLHTNLDVVRYLGERHPAPPPDRDNRAGRIRLRARALLPREEFVRLYCDEHNTLKDIALQVGVSRGTVTRLAREYGIEMRPPHPEAQHSVDADWLYQQYVTERRTLPDIAAECGMSTSNLARWARIHHIPMRSRGEPSHRANIDAKVLAAFSPTLLRPALAKIGGWERLQRFAAATAYPTLTIAAEQLGARALVAQKQRLETDLGVELLHRAQRGQPMQLTKDGQRVLDAVRAMQAKTARTSGRDPDPPAPSPAKESRPPQAHHRRSSH
ncbi:TniQ family protein [Mycobacterium sp.]|uniref:TniQ family protein n=1 Tax=Mycobacterium sp. TaxID=1785 RepID=UPI0025F79256|nr:TniQ family protein [Mycobacterium sp.]